MGAFFALAVGLLVWSYAAPGIGNMSWVLPTVYTFLAYSGAFAIYLLAFGELVSRPAEAEPVPVAVDAHGHGGGHH